MARLVLASGSPRRLELLGQFKETNLRVAVPETDESCDLPAGQAVLEISRGKALAVERREGEIVIAADTLVELDGQTLGKPENEAEARAALRRLSGRWHDVYTGVTVSDGRRTLTEAEHTRVKFAELTDSEIDAYAAAGDPLDKAGAYGIQGRGALFISGIEGDFYNVMGLPLFRLGRMLREFGVELK